MIQIFRLVGFAGNTTIFALPDIGLLRSLECHRVEWPTVGRQKRSRRKTVYLVTEWIIDYLFSDSFSPESAVVRTPYASKEHQFVEKWNGWRDLWNIMVKHLCFQWLVIESCAPWLTSKTLTVFYIFSLTCKSEYCCCYFTNESERTEIERHRENRFCAVFRLLEVSRDVTVEWIKMILKSTCSRHKGYVCV